jgi:AcrR family transcriptional regulator
VRALPGHAARQPPGPKPITRKTAADDQRRRIMRATADLIAKRGYHATTIELIVRRAKVGYATFYKSFPDKEACFLALFDAAASAGIRTVNDAYTANPGPWPDKVAAALGALFESITENPTIARVCLVESLTAGPVAVARYEAALKQLDPILRPGRELNPHSAELPDTLEDTIAGGVLWTAYQRLIVGEADKLPALLPETLELVLSPYVGEAEAVRVVERTQGVSA